MTMMRDTKSVYTKRAGGGYGWRFTEWLVGIVGGIGLFLGLFILFADADEYVGLAGDWSWRVGDISTAWTYWLLLGGGVLLLASLVMVIFGRTRSAAEYVGDKARADLWWHVGIFLAVNAFIWVQDFAVGGGLDYGYWVTIPWAIGLTVHVAMYADRERIEMPPLPPHIEEHERELADH